MSLALLALLLTPPYYASTAAMTGCAVADIYTTQRAVSAGGRELNPAMRSHGSAIKAAITGGIIAVQWVFRKRGPKATAVNLTVASVWCGAAAWNAGQGK